MSLKDDILKELIKSSDYISGQALAEKFDKSRAAVWKAVKSLINDGYSIDAVTNKGYILNHGDEVLNAQNITAYMNEKAVVIYLPEVDSTNNYCKKLLAQGKEGAFIVVSDCQTNGRGRQGKSFYSPPGSGVYFSLAIRPHTTLQNAVTATTAAAVAVCGAIEELTDKSPKIKWVNDVYLDGKKICGILTEAVSNFEDSTVDSVIIGIGINISTSSFPPEITDAGCLDADVNKNKLVALTADKLMATAVSGYAEFIDYYRSHSMIIGEKIKFIKNSQVTYATAISIDETGGLEVELEDKSRIVLRSGEITIRKTE